MELILLLLIFVVFAIRTSWFQTWLAHQASSYLSKELGTEVRIDKVDIVFFDRVDIKGVYIEDIRKDTFIYSNVIHADIADLNLSKPSVNVSNFELDGGNIYLKKYKGDSTLNFQHIVDYFASEEKDTSKTDFDLSVQKIGLRNIRFIYQDQNAEPTESGMDFSNIDLKHVSGDFSDFNFGGSMISLNLDDFQLQDRSGLQLTNLSTKFSYDSTLIAMESFNLGLNNTRLQADYLNLNTPNGPSDFGDFVNKVRFESHIKNSFLSLNDLAFFVPTLKGIQSTLKLNNIEVNGPVYTMRLKNVDITALDTTSIQGNFQIPKLDDLNSAFFNEEITLFRTSISDIEAMHLEDMLDEKGAKTLKSNLKQFKRANVIELTKGEFIGGLEDFVVDGHLKTGIGTLASEYGIKFKFNNVDSLYHYTGHKDPELGKHVIVKNLNMGIIAKNKILGKVSGYLRVKGKGFDEKDLDVEFKGPIYSLGLYDYEYKNITVKRGRFANQKFEGLINIEDDNLALQYDGSVNLKKPMHFDFTVTIDSAQVAQLTKKEKEIYQRLGSKITVDIHGTDPNRFYGDLRVQNFSFKNNEDEFFMDDLSLHVVRDPAADSIILKSPYVNMKLTGKYDITDIDHAITEQFSYVISNIIEKPEKYEGKDEFYTLDIDLIDPNPILQLVNTDLRLAENTHIRSEFNHSEKLFALDINADYLMYDSIRFQEVNIENHFDSVNANLYYFAEEVKVSDSLSVRFLLVESEIEDNSFLTNLGWDGIGDMKPGFLGFKTEVSKDWDLLTTFNSSFFYLNENQYKINKNSQFLWSPEEMVFNDFKISSDEHYLGIEGIVSKDPSKWVNVTVRNFHLRDLNPILGDEMSLNGTVNLDGKIAGVYGVIRFDAESTIDQFYINGYEVGDVRLRSAWNEGSKSVSLQGDLYRERLKTLAFKGNYFLEKEKENIKLDAHFDKTNIAFLNAFEDPELYTDISGILDGVVKVRGELDNPIITGKVDIVESRVKVPMFNVFFGATGTIKLSDGEFISNNLKLYDQEGNQAIANMQIYHYDWADWNYNINLDMDNPKFTKKFLAMNTKYQEGQYYYGTAYVTGFVSIFGYDGNTEITVDVKTQNGTDLTLPMYGSEELEESSFVVYDSAFFLPDTSKTDKNDKDKIERLGMTLNMKFHVTKDAQVKIVFDPLTEDQIVARGKGDLEINMDDYGDLTMFGEYQIQDGAYEMRVKGVVEEDFQLVEGSTVQWSGSPYNALLDVTARFTRVVSLEGIIPPEVSGRAGGKELVFGILHMRNTLLDPELSFDIKAPETDEIGKKALNEIRSDVDELNKQFFALLVLQRFLPRYGSSSGGGGALLSLAETQINSILGGMSESYNLEAGLSEGQTTLGVSTKINDRTTITTSFGVVSGDESEEAASGSNIVGDVDIEYRLNEDGTFTMNFFNETNSSSTASQGQFTQGVSVHYQETFNTLKQFKLLQKFLNIFRKKENKVKFDKEEKDENLVPLPEYRDSTSTN